MLLVSLLIVLAAAMTMAYRERSTVILKNKSGGAVLNVVFAAAQAAAREPRHAVPSLGDGQEASFMVFPQAPCDLRLSFVGVDGRPHQWQGGHIEPQRTHVRLVIDAQNIVRFYPS